MGNKSNFPLAIRDMLLGFLLVSAVAVPIMMDMGYFTPAPYSEVELIEISDNGGHVVMSASFLKTDNCEFRKLAVFGKALGHWVELPWSDPTGEKGDRITGYQSLTLDIVTGGEFYSEIEVRTRHDCGGHKIDRVFINIDMEGVSE